MKFFITLFLATSAFFANAQTKEDEFEKRKIKFPDIPGFQTLKVDLHQHSVFSDGSVWPNIRVQEAIKDGLDAISITDHLEYQPHLDDIPHPDRNRSYEIAKEAADGSRLMIIRGAEITRDMPPGHANAIFLTDINKLNVKKSMDAFREAKAQGAFIFWNHPHWISQQKDGVAQLTKKHKMLIKEGLLNGIEVVNDITYSDEALQIALENDLAIIANSDIHGLIDWQYDIPGGGHRPATLVFAKERSLEGIQEALNEGRSVAWFNNLLIGKEAFVKPLVLESLEIEYSSYKSKSRVLVVRIRNHSDAEYLLENQSGYTFHNNGNVIQLPAHSSTDLLVKTVEKKSEIDLKFSVLNAVIAPNTNPEITINVMIN